MKRIAQHRRCLVASHDAGPRRTGNSAGACRSPFVREHGRMRPGNQNSKRIRGRGRKGPNPLSRTYESNGPDVKIRGTAHHVAEKYQQLARDAAASGDRVMSENYFQHAEHYLRIIAAAQQSMQQPVVLPRGDGHDDEPVQQPERPERQERAERSERGDRQERSERSERRERGGDGPSRPVMPVDAPQPFVEDMPVLKSTAETGGEGGSAKSQDDEDGDDDERGRRRARGTRGRGLRKARQSASPDDKSTDDKTSGEAGASEAETGSDGDKPAKSRARAAKAVNGAEDASADTPAKEAKGSEDKPAPKPRARRTRTAKTAEASETAGETPAPSDA
ncbi:DUF4167 domain-containing protein [Stappia sp.]|uniref:DUF4167 domain-containing protein n=1 Tax=Stappia sp. TaxID=1870903 RepID=UPI0035B4FB4C